MPWYFKETNIITMVLVSLKMREANVIMKVEAKNHYNK